MSVKLLARRRYGYEKARVCGLLIRFLRRQSLGICDAPRHRAGLFDRLELAEHLAQLYALRIGKQRLRRLFALTRREGDDVALLAISWLVV